MRRERDKRGAEWTTLPAAGRVGPVPEWPLEAQTSREVVLWAAMWRRPQAIMWALNGQEFEVALHVRSLVAAEGFMATAAARTLVLRQQEYLGLSMPGLARNHWRIGDVKVEAPPTPPARKPPAARSGNVRSRLKSIDGDKAS